MVDDDAGDVDASGHCDIALLAQNEFAGHVLHTVPFLYFPLLQTHVEPFCTASIGHSHWLLDQLTLIKTSWVQMHLSCVPAGAVDNGGHC
jgi:hypothetical protein